jgi:hypothetical protein
MEKYTQEIKNGTLFDKPLHPGGTVSDEDRETLREIIQAYRKCCEY